MALRTALCSVFTEAHFSKTLLKTRYRDNLFVHKTFQGLEARVHDLSEKFNESVKMNNKLISKVKSVKSCIH